MGYGRRSERRRTKPLRQIRWYQRLGAYGRKVLGAASGAVAGAGAGYLRYGPVGFLPGVVNGGKQGWNHYKAIPAKKKYWKYHRFGSNPTPKYGSNAGTRLGSNNGKGKVYGSNPGPRLGSNPGHRLGSNPGPGSSPKAKGGRMMGPSLGRHHRTHKKPKIRKFSR